MYRKKACLYCTKETTNPKFCCRSCSASFSNAKTPRRRPEGFCKVCNKTIKKSRMYCKECFKKEKLIDPTIISYGSMVQKRSYQKHSVIRDLARRLYIKSGRPKYCAHCGYDKHYEVCHIKGINEHTDDSLLSDINSIDNLIALCPNCHWEFDHLGTEYRDRTCIFNSSYS